MRFSWALACALGICVASVGAARAEGPFLPTCCGQGGPAVAYAPPPCASCAPVTSFYVRRRCGPIRRLLGLCRRPCFSAPILSPAPPLPEPCAPGPMPAPAVLAPPTASPGGPAPVAAEREHGSYLPPTPQPSPPVTGSSFQPKRMPAPVPPRPLTPPQLPPPVRLERITSGEAVHGPFQAIPAVLSR